MLAVKTIAVINQKGGVGKTTTVANLGSAIAAMGHKTLLIDLDPQAHLTLHFGIEPGTYETGIYDVMARGSEIVGASTTVAPGLSVVPSIIDLAAAEVELVSTVGREQILRDSLAARPLPYEYVFIDCPPSLGLLTLNALAAADEVFIPLQPHFLALHGLGKLLDTVSLVQKRINPKLKVSGVILCMYETSTRLAGEVLADLRAFFQAACNTPSPWARTRIFETVIRRNIKLAECPSYGVTIFEYEPHCAGAEDYNALAGEILAAMEQTEPSAPAPEEPGELDGQAGHDAPVQAQPVPAQVDPDAVAAPDVQPVQRQPDTEPSDESNPS